MHPAVRMVNLLVAVAWLPFLGAPVLLACAGGVAAAVVMMQPACRDAVKRGIWRLRWLAVAIMVLYLAFPAGDEPFIITLAEAAARVMVLCIAVAAVQVALFGLSPAAMVDGLARVLAPLGRIGISTETFARRLMLTLSAVPVVQGLAVESRGAGGLVARAAELVDHIERAPPTVQDASRIDTGPVALVQWSWPAAIALAGGILFILGGPR